MLAYPICIPGWLGHCVFMHKLVRFVKQIQWAVEAVVLCQDHFSCFQEAKMNKGGKPHSKPHIFSVLTKQVKCTCYTLAQAHLSCELEKWILTLFDVKQGFWHRNRVSDSF